jgi:hypothetical protein
VYPARAYLVVRVSKVTTVISSDCITNESGSVYGDSGVSSFLSKQVKAVAGRNVSKGLAVSNHLIQVHSVYPMYIIIIPLLLQLQAIVLVSKNIRRNCLHFAITYIRYLLLVYLAIEKSLGQSRLMTLTKDTYPRRLTTTAVSVIDHGDLDLITSSVECIINTSRVGLMCKQFIDS